MKKTYTLLFLLFCYMHLIAQTKSSFTGQVVDSLTTNPLEFCTVAIVDRANFHKAAGGDFSNGTFKIELDKQPDTQYLLYVFAMGYKDKFIELPAKTKSNIGMVKLSPLTQSLKEVIVKADRLQHDIVNGNDVFKIKNSELSQEYSIYTMLGRLPGLFVHNESVSVVGSGTPAFTINGQTPRPGELQAIDPNEVEKVMVSRMPTAKYGSSVNSVIDLQLRTSLKDKIGGRVQNILSYNEYVQEQPKAELNYRNKKLTNYLSYAYQYQNSQSNDESLSQTTLPDKVFSQGSQSLFKEKNKIHTLLFSPKFDINKKSYIDAQYQLLQSRINHQEEGEQFSFDSPENKYISKTPFNRDDKGNAIGHSLMLRYYYAFSDIKNLTINAGYYNNKSHKDNNEVEQIEQNETKTISIQETKSKNYSANAEFNTRLFKKVQFNTGLNYSFIRSDFQMDYNREVQGGKNQSSLDKRHIGSAYATVSQNVNKFFYSVGLRGQYTYAYQSQDNKQFNLMPVIGMNYRISKNISTNFYYRYFISRPSFYDLRSDVYYMNQYLYGTGNPYLKNTNIHSFKWTLSLPKNISFTVNYSLNKNPKLNVYLPYKENSEILLQQPINLKRSSVLNVSGSLWEVVNKYLVMLNLSYSKQFIPRNDLIGEIANTPYFRISWQNEYTIYKGIILYANARYISNNKTYPDRTTSSYGVDAGTRIRIKNFNIMVEGYNLLYKYPRTSTSYGNVFYDSFSHAPRRMLKISISYKFNKLIEPKENKALENNGEIGR